VAHLDSFLVAVLLQQRPPIQIQRISCPQRGQAVNGLPVQTLQDVARGLAEHSEKPAEGGRAGDGLHPQHLSQGRSALQPRHPAKLVRPRQNASHVTQRQIGGIVGVGTGGLRRQRWAQGLAKLLLLQKMRPDHHAAMSRQPLIGKPNADGRPLLFGVNGQLHRLVRLV
jgi:hypothetical protein